MVGKRRGLLNYLKEQDIERISCACCKARFEKIIIDYSGQTGIFRLPVFVTENIGFSK